jgi:uncharacterized protein (DUF927 family)
MEARWGEKQKKLEVHHRLIVWLKDNLLASEPAMAYLTKGRGYSEELIQRLSEVIQLGYLPEGKNYRLPKAIAQFDSNIAKTLRPLAGRIIGPWYDAYGELVGWWGRVIDNPQVPKYLFSKGTKKTAPYLLYLARRFMAKPVLCVVEGILDAGIAQTCGFSQIAACGGAAVPSKAQLEVIHKTGYKVIVLIPDADENGEKAIVKSRGRLLKDISDLGMELLIGEIPPGTGKDIDEILVKANQPVDTMEKIIAQATALKLWLEKYYKKQQDAASSPIEAALIRAESREVQTENTPLLGVENSEDGLMIPTGGWCIPEGWHLDTKGIHRLTINKSGEESSQKISHAPFIISARSVNIDSGHEQLEVAFARDKLLRKIWADRGDLLNHRSIPILATQGFPVTSRNAGLLVDYLADFEASNLHHLPRLLTVSSFGWKRYDGDRFFVLGEQAIGTQLKINFVPEGDGEKNFAKALKTKGTLEGWLQTARKITAYPKVCFALYAGFTPPLLPLLDLPSFSIDFCGESSIGKTTAIMVPASAYGDPVGERGGLVPTWNATSVSIERYASLFKALPIFLDDSHLASDQQVKAVIYMLAGGVGKMRGALKGTQVLLAWHTVGFFTGERPVVSVTTHEGARARVIEFPGSPFLGASGNTVSEIKATLGNHFGHAGPIYLEKLISLIRDKSEDLKRKADQRIRHLKNLAPSGVDNRRASYFASVWTAGVIAEEILNIGGDPDALIPTIFNEVCGDRTDFAQKAMESISSWVMGNWNNFDTEQRETMGEVYGVLKVGEYVAIFPHKLADFLTKSNYSYEAVIRAFRDREWIQTDGRNLAMKIRYRNALTRMIKIFWKFIYQNE